MLIRIVLTAAALSVVPAQAATTIENPVTFVRDVYAHWGSAQPVNDGEIMTPRLAALVALDNKEAGGEVGRGNDFSYWCNCQDGELKNAKVTSRDVENAKGRKVVNARFELEGKKTEIFFYFERGKDGWKLDDARLAGKTGWTYSLILKYGWDDRQ